MEISLGQVLQLIREEKGLSRQEATEKIKHDHLTIDVLKNIETGRTKLQADLIPLFANAYGCSPNYIYSYAYLSESEYIENADMINDLISFFNIADDDMKYLVLYLHNIFQGYFKGCIYEESMISVLPDNIRKAMHFQSVSAFLFAVEEGLIDKNDPTVKKLLECVPTYMDMWNKI